MKELNNFRKFLDEGVFDLLKKDAPKADPTPDDMKQEPELPGYILMLNVGKLKADTVISVDGMMQKLKQDPNTKWVESPSDFIEAWGAMIKSNPGLKAARFIGIPDSLGKEISSLQKADKSKNNLAKLGVPYETQTKISQKAVGGDLFPSGKVKSFPMLNVSSFKDLSEEQIHEGTWGYGSKDSMIKTLAQLDKIRQMGGVKGSLELDKIDDALYRIFGDDEFHDAIDRAKDGATDDDRFANAIGDAQARGQEMLKFHDRVDEEELKENDAVLDEVIEETVFDDIDNNMKLIAVHMSAQETLEDLVAEFSIIPGGTKILAQALRNIVTDNKLTGDLEESLEEATKPDEKEIKTAAAKLMKDPKFKAQYKGKKGVDFVKHARAVAKKSMKKSK